MPKCNFYLNVPEQVSGKSLVMLQMRYHGKKFKYSCRFNVDPKNWDARMQRVKERSATTKDGTVNLNVLLASLKQICTETYTKAMASGIPTNEMLKKPLDEYMFQNVKKNARDMSGPSLYKLIDEFISGGIGDKKSEATITTYRTAKKHLLAFEKAAKYPVTFDSITLDFKDKYVKYLQSEKKIGKTVKKGLGPNAIFKEIKNVKTFMNMAVEREYTTNLKHTRKSFGVKEEETSAVYLTEKELRNLFKYDFSDNKRLEAVRDLFVFQSFVGLRYSDASNIKPENLVKIDGEDFIKVISIKTGTPVTVPCNDIVLKIFKKYEGNSNRLPKAPSNQKFNQFLHELCEIAGLTEKGRLESDMTKPLFECVSSHTARRSFATNCYLAGMDTRMIKAVTGHATEKSFTAYIKVSREENAKRMGEHMKRDLSKKALKIA